LRKCRGNRFLTLCARRRKIRQSVVLAIELKTWPSTP
jgi:hypothetical protein